MEIEFGDGKGRVGGIVDWAKFASLGKQLVGKPYVFGVEVDPMESDPAKIKALDCSELVEWLFAQVGVPVPDGSYNQDKACEKVSGPLKVGDLGFKANPVNGVVHHVGVYIGDNNVLEAKGAQWGVVLTPLFSFTSSTHFTHWGRLKQFVQNA